MNIFAIIAFAVLSVLAAVLLRKNLPEVALLISLAAAITIVLMTADAFSEMISNIGSIFLAEERYLTIPVKALGITLITTLTSKLCEDAGEKAIAFTVSLTGKIGVLLTAIPLFSELAELLMRILKLE